MGEPVKAFEFSYSLLWLQVLKDVLAELYRSLKRIYSSDKDDVTRLHAQLALEELNSGTRMFLFPKPELTKQILVVDHPA